MLSICVGAGTALLGKEAAMACTVAIEDTIVDHYNRSYYVHIRSYGLSYRIFTAHMQHSKAGACIMVESNLPFISFSQLRELLAEDVGDEELLQVHVNMIAYSCIHVRNKL